MRPALLSELRTLSRTMDVIPQNAGGKGSLKAETPWYASYPAARTVAPSITRRELLQWLHDGKCVGRDFVLVDLRRTDFEVCSHAAE